MKLTNADIPFQNNPLSAVNILAKLPSDTTNEVVTAGCITIAFWPYYYGDVYFGEDDCFYDGKGMRRSCPKDMQHF
jgi:hypothetical protein